MCSLMNEQSHGEGDLSFVIVEITEVTQPVASCLEGNVKKKKKESRYGSMCTVFLEHSVNTLPNGQHKG